MGIKFQALWLKLHAEAARKGRHFECETFHFYPFNFQITNPETPHSYKTLFFYMSALIFLQNWPFAKLRLKRNSYLRDKIELTTDFFSLKSSSNFMNYKFDSLLIVCLRREDLEGDLWNSGHRFRLVVTSVTVPKVFYKIILVRFQAVST